MRDEDAIAEIRTPEGRIVRLRAATWNHILVRNPELENEVDLVMSTVAQPDHRELDPRAGRERFFRRGGPHGWMRVVVAFGGPFDRVVTAFPQSNDPDDWSAR